MAWENNRRPLPDWIEDAYQILLDKISDPEEGIEREHAYEVLLNVEKFPDEPRGTEHAIERLLDRGCLYEVKSSLRVTEPETEEE